MTIVAYDIELSKDGVVAVMYNSKVDSNHEITTQTERGKFFSPIGI